MTERKTIYLDEVLGLLERIKTVGADSGRKACIKGQVAYELQCVIKDLPSAQPERKKGEWIIDKDCEGKSRTVTCNLCGHKEFNWHNPNFCPNCGAEMIGDIDG